MRYSSFTTACLASAGLMTAMLSSAYADDAAVVTNSSYPPEVFSMTLSGSYGMTYDSITLDYLPNPLGSRAAGAGFGQQVALGYFPSLLNFDPFLIGLEAFGERSDIRSKVHFLNTSDISEELTLKLKYAYGGLLVGKYNFSPSSSLLVKAGFVSSMWKNAVNGTGLSPYTKVKWLNGYRIEVGSEHALFDDFFVTPSMSYSKYQKTSIIPSDAGGGNPPRYTLAPSNLTAKIGFTYYLSV